MSDNVKFNFEKKKLPSSFFNYGLILSIVGLITIIISYLVDSERAGFNNIIFVAYIVSLGLGCTFLVSLEYISGAVWSVSFRRVAEIFGLLLIIVPIIALPVIFNLGHLFHWAHNIDIHDEILNNKKPYLNSGFFIIRFFIFISLWFLFYFLIIRNSRRQDITSNQILTKRNITLSAIFIPIFALSLSLFAIDWMMSLEPHWYSTIFGVYYFASTMVASLALVTLFVVILYNNKIFPLEINSDHLYSLGALLFAFVNFWAYIAFSQFLLIWYADIPEETFWFIRRWENGWMFISFLLIIVKFIVPYFVLLSQPSKSNTKKLFFISIWLLVGHYLDLYWLVMPEMKKGIVFSFYEIGYVLFTIGIILVLFKKMSDKWNLIPIGDPKLNRNLHFHL